MKDRMLKSDYDELLKRFGWENGVESFDEAMMDLFDEYHPGLPPDRLVCRSYKSIHFSLVVRDNLRLVANRSEAINELVNQRLIDYRKSGRLKRRREIQNEKRSDCRDIPGQLKLPWKPERPPWDKTK